MDVLIDSIMVPNTLIDLRAAINVMTRETMLKLNIQGDLRNTTTMLQLADISTLAPKGITDNVMVSTDS